MKYTNTGQVDVYLKHRLFCLRLPVFFDFIKKFCYNIYVRKRERREI